MTDYFALLEQPRQPWLDLDELKEHFHARTLRDHPDAQPESGSNFAELNEAYQVLRDPKRRLQHLLTLAGQVPAARSDRVPVEIEDLFPAVASLTRDIDAITEKVNKTSNALARSLLRPELDRTQQRITETTDRISRMQGEALVRLQNAGVDDAAELEALYLQFSYLNRWLEQLEEKRTRLFI